MAVEAVHQIGIGLLAGLAAGAVAGWILHRFGTGDWIESAWRQVVMFAGSALAFALADALGGSGFIAAFMGGIAFGAIAKDRGQGFREKMGSCGITITNSQTANWSIKEGKEVTEAWLKQSKDVQGIFGQNDEMAFGAIEALKEAGLVPAQDVKIISVDATSGAFQAMLDGTLNGAIECNPLLAPQVYEAALAALNGETLPKWIPSQESEFYMTDENLKEVAAGRKY